MILQGLVPTQQMLAGDFSQSGKVIRDPLDLQLPAEAIEELKLGVGRLRFIVIVLIAHSATSVAERQIHLLRRLVRLER